MKKKYAKDLKEGDEVEIKELKRGKWYGKIKYTKRLANLSYGIIKWADGGYIYGIYFDFKMYTMSRQMLKNPKKAGK